MHERNSSTLYIQKLDWLAREFSCKRRDAQEVVIPITIFDFQVVSLAIAKFGKASRNGVKLGARCAVSQPILRVFVAVCALAQCVAVAMTTADVRKARLFIPPSLLEKCTM